MTKRRARGACLSQRAQYPLGRSEATWRPRLMPNGRSQPQTVRGYEAAEETVDPSCCGGQGQSESWCPAKTQNKIHYAKLSYINSWIIELIINFRFEFNSTPLIKKITITATKKERFIQNGYRKCGTHEWVQPPPFAYGNSKNKWDYETEQEGKVSADTSPPQAKSAPLRQARCWGWT